VLPPLSGSGEDKIAKFTGSPVGVLANTLGSYISVIVWTIETACGLNSQVYGSFGTVA